MNLSYINILKICANAIGISYTVVSLVGVIIGFITLGYINFEEFVDKELLNFMVHLIILQVSVILLVGVYEEKHKLFLPWIIAIVLNAVLECFTSLYPQYWVLILLSLTCICMLHRKLSTEPQNSQPVKISNEEDPVVV